jgi:riboflavin synthase
MFTGIIEELGTVVDQIAERSSVRLQIRADRVFREENPQGLTAEAGSESGENGLKIDDSVSVNGVCLTVVAVRPPIFEVIAVQETLQKTTLGSLTVDWGNSAENGHRTVNLERAATLRTRLGGHIVQGHVDGTARIAEIRDLAGSWEFYFELPPAMSRYVVPTGSVTLDGVSLTVASIADSTLKVAIIPHTYRHTNFQYLKVGDRVNLEVDVIAKMVEQMVKPYTK